MNDIIAYLVQRDGRSLFSVESPEWALSDPDYLVIELVKNDQMLEAELISCKDARDTYAELYQLVDEECSMLKARIKELEK